jgi:hypothetical protein
MSPCDAVLVRAPLPSSPPLVAAFQAAVHEADMRPVSTRLHLAESDAIMHLEMEFAAPVPVCVEQLENLVRAVSARCALRADTVTAARLALAFERGALGAGVAAPFHYVVETNAAQGWFDEMVRWYDTEHMPGLAAVPGCIRARRYVNLDGGPLSCAAYDLTSPAVLTSAPWLAVRATDWASRVRPHFRDTVRTVFRSIAATSPAHAALEA